MHHLGRGEGIEVYSQLTYKPRYSELTPTDSRLQRDALSSDWRATVPVMPDSELTKEVIDVSLRLIDADRAGETEGKDVAAEIDRPEIDLHYAFKEAQRQGVLEMYFPSGLGLPSMIRRP